jgi:hypothetical protein
MSSIKKHKVQLVQPGQRNEKTQTHLIRKDLDNLLILHVILNEDF